jgi:adenosylhomocysteinase
MKYDVKDKALAKLGRGRVEWAERQMPVLGLLKKEFTRQKPLKNIRIGACLHVTTETAVLMMTLKAGGAQVALCASNPLSTQDDVAAFLVKDQGIPTYAVKGEGRERYYSHINAVLDIKPHITMDDGADLVSTIHGVRKDLVKTMIGGTEETTTGVIRLRSLAEQGKLLFPVIAVNDAKTKHFFDNRYGTGQSTIDGILRATNILYAGKTFVVVGYGQCGRGVSTRAKGMGSNVIVCEVNPLRALEAVMDGFRVMPIAKAAREGDLFVTVTGDTSAIDESAIKVMKDGAIMANSGHFDVEINKVALKKLSKKVRTIRPFVEEFTLKNGNRVYLLGEGRLINLAAAEGHPSIVMDMSFCNQALSSRYMVEEGSKLAKQVYVVPRVLDEEIARLKLKSMGIKIDTLTPEQEKYLCSWEIGT